MTRTIGRKEWEGIKSVLIYAEGPLTLAHFSSIRLPRGSPLILGAYHLGPWLTAFCWRGEVLAYDPEMA